MARAINQQCKLHLGIRALVTIWIIKVSHLWFVVFIYISQATIPSDFYFFFSIIVWTRLYFLTIRICVLIQKGLPLNTRQYICCSYMFISDNFCFFIVFEYGNVCWWSLNKRKIKITWDNKLKTTYIYIYLHIFHRILDKHNSLSIIALGEFSLPLVRFLQVISSC